MSHNELKNRAGKTANVHDLFTQIDVLKAVVEDHVRDAVSHGKQRFVGHGDSWFPHLTDQKKNSILLSFKHLKKEWYAFMEERIPVGGERRKSIDRIFDDIRMAVRGSIPFEHKYSAQYKYRRLYLSCFERLERMTEELTRTCLIKSFWKEKEDVFTAFRRQHGTAQNIFVSINYGGDEYPDDVLRILELLENQQLRNNSIIRFHLARKNFLDDDDAPEILDKTRVIMEECDAAMVFFTESHRETTNTDQNTNVVFELGYLMALEKRPRVFSHDSVTLESFSLLSGLDIQTYDDVNELKEHFEKFTADVLGSNWDDCVSTGDTVVNLNEILGRKPR